MAHWNEYESWLDKIDEVRHGTYLLEASLTPHWHDIQEDLSFRPHPGFLTERSLGNNTNHSGTLPITSSTGPSFDAPSHRHGNLPTKSSAAISSEVPFKLYQDHPLLTLLPL